MENDDDDDIFANFAIASYFCLTPTPLGLLPHFLWLLKNIRENYTPLRTIINHDMQIKYIYNRLESMYKLNDNVLLTSKSKT